MNSILFHIVYATKGLIRNWLYGLIYLLIVGLGIYASVIFYTYITENYIQMTIPAPVEAKEVYTIPLEDINGDYWMYSAYDIKEIERLLGNEALLAPVISKKVAAQSELTKRIIYGVSYSPKLGSIFTFSIFYGSLFSDNDQHVKKCILSYKANQEFFQGENSVGRSINLNGEEFEVSGVASPDSLGFLNFRSDGFMVLIPESQFMLIDQDLSRQMYYSNLFVKSNLDRLTIDRLYQFINEQILSQRGTGGVNKRLRSITTLDRYLKEKTRNHWSETLLLLFIVSFGFFTSLAYQISLSLLFHVNRIKNTGIELLVGASFWGIFTEILISNLILSFLGLLFSFGLAYFINQLMIIAGQPLISFNYRYVYLLINIQLVCIMIASSASLIRVKAQRPLQIIQK